LIIRLRSESRLAQARATNHGITKFAGIIDLPLIVYGDELIKHHDLIYSTTKKF
jgi:hypothetical protein